MSRKLWSDDGLRKLDTLYGRFPPKIIAAQLGRTERSILNRGCLMRKEQQRVEMARSLRERSTGNRVRHVQEC